MMGRYQRRSEEVDAMMVEAYVSGVSQRKMGDVTEALMGERVGRSTVSRVAKRSTRACKRCGVHPSRGPTYLYLDADVPRCPLGPKGRERERARGLRRGPGRPPPAPGHHAGP